MMQRRNFCRVKNSLRIIFDKLPVLKSAQAKFIAAKECGQRPTQFSLDANNAYSGPRPVSACRNIHPDRRCEHFAYHRHDTASTLFTHSINAERV